MAEVKTEIRATHDLVKQMQTEYTDMLRSLGYMKQQFGNTLRAFFPDIKLRHLESTFTYIDGTRLLLDVQASLIVKQLSDFDESRNIKLLKEAGLGKTSESKWELPNWINFDFSEGIITIRQLGCNMQFPDIYIFGKKRFNQDTVRWVSFDTMVQLIAKTNIYEPSEVAEGVPL
jgi:hypothetical protein